MKNYQHKFLVKPKVKIKLRSYDPSYRGKYESDEIAKPEIEKYLAKIDSLQYLMYAENKNSMLIVLQGLDAAGKDGVIRHILTGLNPQGCTVKGFKEPTTEEASHDFLWRIHPHAPLRGSVAIFNRSHYEDVLITQVHKTISRKECSKRYHSINDFEKLLVEEGKTTVLKFFLHISKSEQLARFKQRLDDPARRWKISEGDYKEREYWDRYTKAYEDLLHKTSTEHAPWYIIPSDHKWFRNLAISQIVTRAFESLKMKSPQPSVDIAKIRRKYHAAVAKENPSH